MADNHPDAPFKIPVTYFTKYLGFQTESPEPGRTELTLELQPQHLNIAGAVHGGFLMTVLDTLMGHAVFTYLGDPQTQLVQPGFATSSMTTHFLETMNGGTLTGEGWVVKQYDLYVAAEAELKDGEGRLVATAEAIFTILRPES